MAQGIRTAEQLEEVVAAYKEFDEFVIDVETTGDHRLNTQRNEVFWLSLAGPGRADAIPCGHPVGERVVYDEDDEMHRIQYTKAGTAKYQERRVNETSGRLKWFPVEPQFTPAPEQLWRIDVTEALRPLLFSDRRKIGHKVKFDIESLAKYYGELPPGPYIDTIVAARLVDENQQSYRLGDCVRRQFKYKYDKIGKDVEKHPYSEALLYSYLDSKMDWLLWRDLEPLLRRHGVLHIFEDIEMPLVPLIMDMEMTGMSIDHAVLDELGEQWAREMAAIQIAIDDRAGKHINLNASRQKAEFVYDTLGKTCRVFTEKTGERSTSRETLEAFKKNKYVGKILDYSSLQKLQSSFIESLRRFSYEGKVHPDFNQVGARSGRTSCSEPNMQQIPQRSARGRRVRELFVASPGCVLVVADLSQIELRVLAHYTQDPKLRRAYRDGLDLHAMTAEAVWGVDFTPEHRGLAKNGNFSVVFGAGPGVLVRKYDYPNLRVAKDFLATFYATYRRVNPWKDTVWEAARRSYKRGKTQPYVETILGRRRRLPGLMSTDNYVRYGAERQAISTLIQGSAADLFKVIMLETDRAMQAERLRGHILMTVHDEIIAEVPKKKAEEALALVKSTMESCTNPFTGEPILSVPLVADAKIVQRWSDAKD